MDEDRYWQKLACGTLLQTVDVSEQLPSQPAPSHCFDEFLQVQHVGLQSVGALQLSPAAFVPVSCTGDDGHELPLACSPWTLSVKLLEQPAATHVATSIPHAMFMTPTLS